jgi:hypothetical protein
MSVKILEIGTSPPNNPRIKVFLKMPLNHALEWIQYMMGVQPVQILKDEQVEIEFIEIRSLNVYTQTVLPLQLQPYASIIKECLLVARTYNFTDNNLNYIK